MHSFIFFLSLSFEHGIPSPAAPSAIVLAEDGVIAAFLLCPKQHADYPGLLPA